METFTDDTVVALASFLSPHDMLNLALTCKRFGDKHGAATKRSRRLAAREAKKSSGREVRQKPDTTISLMEVAAHTALHAKCTDEEKNALPRRGDESWIGIYQEFFKLFRHSLKFDKLVGGRIHYDTFKSLSSPNNMRSYVYAQQLPGQRNTYCAISSNIMRAGRHSVLFAFDTLEGVGGSIRCGIIRPTTKDITSLEQCNPVNDDLSRFSFKDYETSYHKNRVDCCLLNTYNGNQLIRRRWKKWNESELMAMDEETRSRAVMQNHCLIKPGWEGMEVTHEAEFKIGLTLDLDAGTLDVYKNGRRLGTMKTRLTGEYCWVVALSPGSSDMSASIRR